MATIPAPPPPTQQAVGAEVALMDAARELAKDFPKYALPNGRPNLPHIFNAGKAAGYPKIGRDNLREAFAAIRARAGEQAGGAAQDKAVPGSGADRFEYYAVVWATRTSERPALCRGVEADAIRQQHRTDEARYKALAGLCKTRQAWWEQRFRGIYPAVALTAPEVREACEFFEANGAQPLFAETPVPTAMADKPGEKGKPAPTATPPPPVEEKTKAAPSATPAPVLAKPVQEAGNGKTTPGAGGGLPDGGCGQIEIDFVSKAGFGGRLVVAFGSAGELGRALGAAERALGAAGAKPKPAASAAVAPGPAAGGGGGGGDAPRCKYHGRPMKEGKGGKWFCSAKIQGGGYCDYTVE